MARSTKKAQSYNEVYITQSLLRALCVMDLQIVISSSILIYVMFL
jgi:hypothetical protein